MKDFKNIYQFSDYSGYKSVLVVNPRNGELIEDLLNSNIAIDSFVSDDEWVISAQAFSKNVYHAYSHHPLAKIPSETYDAIIICEDMGYVDDCDRMISSYYRLLKKGGTLYGINENLSYGGTISALINDTNTNIKSDICGYSCIAIDALISRLKELGFANLKLKAIFGNSIDVSTHLLSSAKNFSPLSEEDLEAKFYYITAIK